MTTVTVSSFGVEEKVRFIAVERDRSELRRRYELLLEGQERSTRRQPGSGAPNRG